ncbi:MAG: class I SAM-dependent methyltransferase [Acidobacteriota bacterium]
MVESIRSEMAAIILEFVKCCRPDFRSCLELGTSGGGLELEFLDHFPNLKIDSYNLSSKEKAAVENRLIFHQGRFKFFVTDYRKEKIGHDYDLIFSYFDISRLAKEEKQRLFLKVHQLMVDDGLFIYGDLIRPASERIKKVYLSKESKKPHEPFHEFSEAAEALKELPENVGLFTMDDQMYWMRKAAFKDVDCIWKLFHRAVFAGFK